MLATLTTIDGVTWVSIIVKSLAYGATLMAVGSVLVLVSLRSLSEDGRVAVRRTAALSALAAAVFTGLRLPLRASFLMGGTWDGAVDPVILGMVADSPLGTSAIARLVGLTLVACVLWPTRVGQVLALAGAFLASASFALRGHALGEPQMVLGALVTLHIICLSFWVGAFAPLIRATRIDPPANAGALAHEFGRLAAWAVGGLVLVGGLALVFLGAATPSVLTSPYGQMFAVKLILFAGVLSLAAVNKLRLTPALHASTPGSGMRLRRSIRVEMIFVAGVLVTTATLTTVSSPPSGGENDQASLNTHALSPENQVDRDAS